MKKKITLIILLILLIVLAMPDTILAANATTHDYSEINKLESDYSYGTLFWSNDTKFEELSDNTAERNPDAETDERPYSYNVYPGEVLSLRITNCAVDKDGDLCDVICKITGVTLFSEDNLHNSGNRVYLEIGKYTESKEESNLIRFWFQTRSASGHFAMQYVKTGTTTPANITKAAASIGDIDVPQTDKTGDLWLGSEGFTIDDAKGEVYYKKGNWLVDANGEKGVRAPNVEGNIDIKEDKEIPSGVKGVVNDDNLDLYNSAVATEEMGENATFKLFYSGYGCGIIYVFASPYTFELDNPTKSTTKAVVSEGEKFNYKITQYIPNNYYASELNFIENTPGKYTSITIQDTLDSKLALDGNITVTNESGQTVSYFNTSVIGKNIIATAKSNALNDINFYAHSYTINVPVVVSNVAGTEKISNTATTVVSMGESDTDTKKSNTVDVTLKYKVTFDTNGGTSTPEVQEVLGGNKATNPAYTGTKTGYTFGGWSVTDPDTSAPQLYNFDEKVYEDKTLYAIWTPINYNITYVLNGGTNDNANPSTYTVEDTIDFKNPTRDGYDFKGWYSDENFTTPKDGISNETGDVTVYAKWEAQSDIPYKVEHYKEDDNGEYTLAVTDELTGTTDELAIAEPKEYTGFEENKTYSERVSQGTIKGDGSLVLKLYYDKEEYTVTFDTRGGSPKPDNQTVKYQDTATEPEDPEREGYEFEYWYYINEDGEEVRYNFDDPVTSNVDLIAKWEGVTTPVETVPKDIDTTVATTPIPQTGETKKIIIAASIIVIIGIIFGVGYFSLREIK